MCKIKTCANVLTVRFGFRTADIEVHVVCTPVHETAVVAVELMAVVTARLGVPVEC
jgi:hypothetical protein